MRVAKATTSKNEKIDDKKINEIIEICLNNKNQMKILLDYIKVKLYIMNDKWIKLMKILYLILALLVKSQNEKEIVAFVSSHLLRIKTLTKFKYIVGKDDKGATIRLSAKEIIKRVERGEEKTENKQKIIKKEEENQIDESNKVGKKPKKDLNEYLLNIDENDFEF